MAYEVKCNYLKPVDCIECEKRLLELLLLDVIETIEFPEPRNDQDN